MTVEIIVRQDVDDKTEILQKWTYPINYLYNLRDPHHELWYRVRMLEKNVNTEFFKKKGIISNDEF